MSYPIIITAEMGKADQAWANGLRRAHFPAERNYLDAHITLFHHLPPSHLSEIKSRLATLASQCPPPAARLSEVMLLGRSVAYRIDSPELLAIRDELAADLQGLLIPWARSFLSGNPDQWGDSRWRRQLSSFLLHSTSHRDADHFGASAGHFK